MTSPDPHLLGYSNALPIRIFYKRIALGTSLLAARSLLGIPAAAWFLLQPEWTRSDVLLAGTLRALAALLTALGIFVLAAAVWTLDRDGRNRRAARWAVFAGWLVAWAAVAAAAITLISALRTGLVPPKLELLGVGILATALSAGELALLIAAFFFLRHLAIIAPRARVLPEMLYWFIPALAVALTLRVLRAMLTAALLLPHAPFNLTFVAGPYLLAGPWLMIAEDLLLAILWMRLGIAVRRLKRKMYALPVG